MSTKKLTIKSSTWVRHLITILVQGRGGGIWTSQSLKVQMCMGSHISIIFSYFSLQINFDLSHRFFQRYTKNLANSEIVNLTLGSVLTFDPLSKWGTQLKWLNLCQFKTNAYCLNFLLLVVCKVSQSSAWSCYGWDGKTWPQSVS